MILISLMYSIRTIMLKMYPKTILLLTCLYVSVSSYSQAPVINVRMIGNCGLEMTDGTSTIYFDFPYKSGAHKYMTYEPSELDSMKPNSVLIFTHRHADHYSKKLVNRVRSKHHGMVFGNWNTKELIRLGDSIPDFTIQAFKTSHLFTVRHYSYLIVWHGKRIYVSGDTGDWTIPTTLKNLDWAFMNPWIFMNAQNAKAKVDAKMIGIYHLYPFQKLQDTIPSHILFLKKQGEIISIR